jgi:ornithine carbamoyltransferase
MKTLLNISDLTKKDFNEILVNAKNFNIDTDRSLTNKNIGLIFEKNSTRTRLSFQVGIKQLNGNFIDIRLEELNLNRFESYEDTFEIMACYLDCLVFRTTDHAKLELSKKYFKKPVINALSDISHPCQAISDIYTLNEYFGSADNLNISWMGDINNVLLSLVESIKFLENTKINIFTERKIYEKHKHKFSNNKKVSFYFDLNDKILFESDCVMTDVFNSMNDKDDKELLLKKFQINSQLMARVKKTAVFMHCLPAKIDSEVTEDVLKGPQSIVLKQAKNRLVAQRGILKWLDI